MIKFTAGQQYIPNQVIWKNGKLIKILEVKISRTLSGFSFKYLAKILNAK